MAKPPIDDISSTPNSERVSPDIRKDPPLDPAAQHPQVVLGVPPGLVLPAGLAASHVALQQIQVWQGQFPPPEAIERYEQVMPGAFDRLMKMAELQQAASISANSEARTLLSSDTRRGHWLGFSVTCAAMACALVCAIVREPWVAGIFLSVPVLSVAKALIDSAKGSTATQTLTLQTGIAPSPPVQSIDSTHKQSDS